MISLELEIKYRVHDRVSLKELLDSRINIFTPVGAFTKKDMYYKNDKRHVRIRSEESSGVVLTLKDKSVVEGFESNKEVELHLLSMTNAVEFISMLGFEFGYSKEKTGFAYSHQDILLELHTVTSQNFIIGTFLEIECKTKENPQFTRKRIEQLAKDIGLSEDDKEIKSYMELIFEKLSM